MPNRRDILSLYKQLLRYGQQLQLTDKNYYQQRIVNEFKKNKALDTKEDITYNFKVGSLPLVTSSNLIFISLILSLLLFFKNSSIFNLKDLSLVSADTEKW